MAIQSKNFSKVLKRFNRNNKGGAMNKDSGGVSIGVPIPKRNIASIIGNFNEGPRNRSNTSNNNPDSNTENVKVSAAYKLNVQTR